MKTKRNPWLWVTTTYFAEGIPYFIVNNISVIMFKKMGMTNGDMALYTSLLYLPWLIKPFWSPFVDVLKSKRWWIIITEFLMVALFALLTVTMPTTTGEEMTLYRTTLVLFWICAFASATHDIAVDGFYMLGLDGKQQSLFVGIRSTFYRLSNLFVQGALVMVAGYLETRTSSIPQSWRLTFLGISVLWALISIYHLIILPYPTGDLNRVRRSTGEIFREFGQSFATFFKKPLVWLGIAFMLLYRLPEAFALKIVPAFMVDGAEAGGLELSTTQYGLVNNTLGVIGIVAGGILGGVYIAKKGLKKSLWPMALALALPCIVYLYMAIRLTVPLWLVGACVFVEQFGYGFGFTAYMLYMMYISDGEFKTSHYSLCTAFMAASMMLPGMFAGKIQESMGYPTYFGFVMLCCLATAAAVIIVKYKIPADFGKK